MLSTVFFNSRQILPFQTSCALYGTLNSPEQIGITKGKLSGLHTNTYWRFNGKKRPSLEAGQITLIVTDSLSVTRLHAYEEQKGEPSKALLFVTIIFISGSVGDT